MILIPLLVVSFVTAHASPHPTSSTQKASTFAGATLVNIFPPAEASVTATDTLFLHASDVGFAGPTRSK